MSLTKSGWSWPIFITVIGGILFAAFVIISSFDNRFDNVTRVFWHENTRYSIHFEQDGSKEIQVKTFTRVEKVKLIKDVSTEEHMWVRAVGGKVLLGFTFYSLLEIHVHSEKDVEGGAWDHGKNGSGNTVVIQ